MILYENTSIHHQIDVIWVCLLRPFPFVYFVLFMYLSMYLPICFYHLSTYCLIFTKWYIQSAYIDGTLFSLDYFIANI